MFCIGVFCITEFMALLCTISERYIATVIVDMIRSVSPIAYRIPLSFNMQTIPIVAHIEISFRKLCFTFIQGGVIVLVLALAFTPFGRYAFVGNSNMGCVQQFSNAVTSCGTMFLTYLNMQSYTELYVEYPTVLYFIQIFYVLNIGILWYNLMIALFTDIFSKVQERIAFEATFSELMAQLQFEAAVLRLPFFRTIHLPFSSFFLQRSFLKDEGRILIVERKMYQKVHSK